MRCDRGVGVVQMEMAQPMVEASAGRVECHRIDLLGEFYVHERMRFVAHCCDEGFAGA